MRTLHPCQNTTVDMEPGGPLVHTKCEKPAKRRFVDGQLWWLCDEHAVVFKAEEA